MMANRFFSTPQLKFLFISGILYSFLLPNISETLNIIIGDTPEIIQIDWQQDSEEENQDTSQEKDKKLESQYDFSKRLLSFKTKRGTNPIINFYNASFKEIFSPPPEV
ncbi:MAG: hypothetical protein VW710_00545 [Flavobacteriaceae bacterium]|jgi:hypothetical protein